MPRVKQSPRNSVSDRPSGWRLMLRRQRRLLRPAAYVVAAMLAVAGIASGLRAAGGSSLVTLRDRLGSATAISGLRVTDIRIDGRENTPDPLLRAALGVSKGDPILGFSVEAARQRIESLSWVEHATVVRRLPDTILVYVQERAPFAIWQNKGKFVLVDRKGQVVNQDVSQFRKLPLIVGEGAPAAATGLLVALIDRPALAEKVSASVRVGERRWNLHMTNGTDVLLPEGHEIAALDRLMQLEQEHSVLERPLAVIDMRLPDRLVLRPKADASKDALKDGAIVPPVPPSGGSPATVPVVAKKPT